MRAKEIFLCLALLLTVSSASGAVLYVRADAAGPEINGLSWATAFKASPQALQYAASGDEVWVAAGNYFGLINVPAGVALYGGFAGDETVRTQRDWSRNPSVIDPSQWDNIIAEFIPSHPAVLLAIGSRLDGFTIIDGRYSYGAGIYAGDSGATIANNIIVTNRATGILPGIVLVDRAGQFEVGDDFFLKTANELLRLQFPFGATNIPLSEYGPAIHRLLQVAANIYDAVHSNSFPSVFRPRFTSTPDGPIISGYAQDHSMDTLVPWLSTNAYPIPMIVGTRKGFPNFNEFVLETVVSAARKLEMRRQTTNSRPFQTNEMYILGMENRLGLEAWNSYTNGYSNRLDVAIANRLTISITNNDGFVLLTNHVFSAATNYEIWPGFVRPQVTYPLNALSFKVPLYTNVVNLSNGIYRAGSPGWIEPLGNTNDYVANSGFHIPQWTLTVSNDLVFVLHAGGRIVDFVHLVFTNAVGLTTNFFNVNANVPGYGEGPVALCWSTNRPGSSIYVRTEGVQQQIDISLGQVGNVSPQQWAEYANVSDPQKAIESFRFFVFPDIYPGTNNTNLIQQVPFTPARKILLTARWEANDPFLHTLPEHLKDLTNNFNLQMLRPFTSVPMTNQSLGMLNWRYRPWGGRPGQIPLGDEIDPRAKDAGLRKTDDFNFPNGTEVNINWLDRIHRGTPWQTIYFDRDAAPMSTWVRQSWDQVTHPTNDWKIIDYLRGQLSFPGAANPTRVVNNTIVGNEGGIWIGANASATVMNNAVAHNTSAFFDEGASLVELSHNCFSCSPQFVNPAAGDYSLLATSPLIDAGNDIALGWMERTVFGAEVDIGAFEFGPEGVPVFTFQRTSASQFELTLRGFAGQSYLIEASTDLANWTAISTNVAMMGDLVLHDAAATNYTHRFYRAKVANHPN